MTALAFLLVFAIGTTIVAIGTRRRVQKRNERIVRERQERRS